MAYKKVFKIENNVLYEGELQTMKRTNAGECFYCKEPIYVSSGQAIQHIQITSPFKGIIAEHPIHKRCKKKDKQIMYI